MQPSYQYKSLGEVTNADGWARIRLAFGIEGFGITGLVDVKAGAEVINPHREAEQEELYIVTGGHARFTVDGVEIDAPAGQMVHVREPTLLRSAVAVADGTTVLVVGGVPGKPYPLEGWEGYLDEMLTLFGERRYADARDLLERAREDYPDSAFVNYNLACALAQTGNSEAALARLGEALRKRPGMTAQAAGDDDLAALRGDARFEQLVAGD